MSLFGMKWDRKRLMPGDPAQMTMQNIVEGDQVLPPDMQMPPMGTILGGESRMERLPGFYAGGDKFTGRDAIAGLLAAIGDGLSRNSGGEGNAMDNLGYMRLSAIKMAKEQAQQQALMEAAQRRGLSPDDVTLQQGGIDMPKAPDLPERARLAQWYQNASPEERAAYDQTNPIITNGYGSAVVPRSSFPSGLDPNRWERLPDDEGGPTPQASGGFLGSRRFRR